MFKRLLTSCCLALTSLSTLQAGCLACDDGIVGPNDEFPIIWTKVITLSGGPGWTHAGDTQQQFTTPVLFNTYIADKKTNMLGEGEIYFSLQHAMTNYLTGRWGIAAAGSSPARLQGTVLLNSDPNQRAYAYSYRIAHGRIALKSVLLFGTKEQKILPYLMGSIGLAFNASHQYKQTPKSNIYPIVPTFRSNTDSNAFAYTLGAGVEGAFSQHWHAGFGYQFADWGKSNLDSVAGQPFDEGLRLSRLYTHLAQFSITYIC